MSTPEFVTVRLYAHWASALVNDDATGLEDDEEAELNDYIASQSPHYDMFACVGKEDDDDFGRPDIPGALPGTVATFTFQIHK